MNWTSESKVIIQGITEAVIEDYVANMKAYGTNIVAIISAGQGGEILNEIPVFDLVEQAIAEVGEVQTSLIFSWSYQVLDAAYEAMSNGIKEIIILSTGVPPLDMVELLKKAETTKTNIVGPGSGGIIIPGKVLLGNCETDFYTSGSVALISRSHWLNDEIAIALKQADLGESIAISLGNEKIIGSSWEQWLEILENDANTDVIVVIGQIDELEQISTQNIGKVRKKRVIFYPYGLYTPVEKVFRDAHSIIANQLLYPIPTIKTDLTKAKMLMAKRPSMVPELVKKYLTNKDEKKL